MKMINRAGLPIRYTLVFAMGMFVASRGGGSQPDSPKPPSLFSVSGTVSGATQGAAVTLKNNGDAVTVAEDGPFSFPLKVRAGASYDVSASNPPGYACSVKNATGSVGASDVTNITVKCIPFTLAGAVSPVQQPAGIAIDANGNTFVLDVENQVIVKYTKAGVVVRISPAGVRTTLVDETMARAALNIGDRFESFVPQGLAYDSAGNLYISDTGSIVVYKYSNSGALTVFAGTPTVEGDTDGPVGTASFGFYTAEWMAVDDGGNPYLSGQGKLRKISPTGVVSTPSLAWGDPNLGAMAYHQGVLYGTTRYAILQLPVE